MKKSKQKTNRAKLPWNFILTLILGFILAFPSLSISGPDDPKEELADYQKFIVGEWEWIQTTDETYVLVVSNKNNYNVQFEVIFTLDDSVSELCCGSIFIIIGIFLAVVIIGIVLNSAIFGP